MTGVISKVRQQLKAFLLRHGVRYGGKTSWTQAYWRWVASLSFEVQASQTAFTEYWPAVQAAEERVQRLTQALKASTGASSRWLLPCRRCAASMRSAPSR